MITQTGLPIVRDNRPNPLGASRPPLAHRLAALGAHLWACARIGADYYRAAALYEQLSRFSDAALRRRGLSRATLGRDMARACDRTGGRMARFPRAGADRTGHAERPAPSWARGISIWHVTPSGANSCSTDPRSS